MAYIFTIILLAALVGIAKPFIKGAKRSHFALAAFASFVLIGVTAPAVEESSDGVAAETAEAQSVASPEQAAATKDAESLWMYDEDVDQMRDETSYYANLEGTNTVNLDFPYGDQKGRILLRQAPRFGFDVLIGVGSGQIMCSTYRDSYLNVKFDDGPIKRYRCNEASDGTSDMVFVRDSRGFLANLKNSEKLIVEAEFFQNGIQQMTFDTAGLEWEH